LVLEAPSEEEVLEAENLSQKQASNSDIDLISILLSAEELQRQIRLFGQHQYHRKDEFASFMDACNALRCKLQHLIQP